MGPVGDFLDYVMAYEIILTKNWALGLSHFAGWSLFDRQVTGDRTSLAAYLDPQIFRGRKTGDIQGQHGETGNWIMNEDV